MQEKGVGCREGKDLWVWVGSHSSSVGKENEGLRGNIVGVGSRSVMGAGGMWE